MLQLLVLKSKKTYKKKKIKTIFNLSIYIIINNIIIVTK